MNRINISLLVLTFLVCDSYSQNLIHEFPSKGRLKGFNGIAIGDSILFSYEENSLDGHTMQSKWISQSTAAPYNIPVNVFKAANSGNDIYFYFLEGKPKARELRAIAYNRTSKERREVNHSLNLPGTIIGSYVDKNLFIILLQDKGLTLSLLEINQLNIVSEKKFKLPIDLSYYLWTEFSSDVYYNESDIHSFKGWSYCKIFVRDKIFITIDKRSSKEPWKTTVLTLDQNLLDVKALSFNTSSNSHFSSFILDDKLFRTFNGKKKYNLEIFSLESRKLISKSELLADHKDFLVYFRHGRKNIVGNKATFSDMRKGVQLTDPLLVVSKANGKYLLQWGTYFDDNGMAAGSATPAGAISMLVGSVILHLMEGPGVAGYFYYEWNETENTFQITETPTESIRQKIDSYEIAQSTDFKYKNYIEYKDGIAGIYYNAKDDKVSLVYFE